MTKRTFGILIAAICSSLLVGVILATKPKKPPASTDNNELQQISASTVATHSTQADCWTIISGKVYDVTEYVSNHPGGSEILRACGKDATELFTTRRDGGERVGSGTPHSSSAKSTLESFQIGTLAN